MKQIELIRCYRCSQIVSDDNKYCPNCGLDVEISKWIWESSETDAGVDALTFEMAAQIRLSFGASSTGLFSLLRDGRNFTADCADFSGFTRRAPLAVFGREHYNQRWAGHRFCPVACCLRSGVPTVFVGIACFKGMRRFGSLC